MIGPPPENDARRRPGRWGGGRLRLAGLLSLLVAGVLGALACEGIGLSLPPPPEPSRPPPPSPERPAPTPPSPPTRGEAAEPVPTASIPSDRGIAFLERSLAQTRKLARAIPRLGPERDAAGALAAAVLAAHGHETGGAAADHGRSLLAACTGRWHTVHCERAQLTLQRLVLQVPQVVAPPLGKRLRAEAATAAPPPSAEEIAHPWSFRETENQRTLKMARSLVAHVIAGTAGSPAARAWERYAVAFLEAHDREGWYEADSPGYLAISMEGLLLLADHAPGGRVRDLAARQLNLLFAAWAQNQVGGFPAGAKSRTYVQWALSPDNTPWKAWAWLLAGIGDPATINFRDSPQLAAARYRVPEPVVELLAARRLQAPYEIRERRRFHLAHRADVDAALYGYATPDYILGASQAVEGLRLAVSGGQEIAAALYAEGPAFAPVYLWSRTDNPRSERWKSQAGEDMAVAQGPRLVALLGRRGGGGHAYLAKAWGRPEVLGKVAVARYGETYVAFVAREGWEAAPAGRRFPGYYGDTRSFGGSWVLVPRGRPAAVGLVVGRRAEDGDLEAWKRRVSRARLTLDGSTLRLDTPGAPPLVFTPGKAAAVGGRAIRPAAWPLLGAPFLSSRGGGSWEFSFGRYHYRLSPLP